MEGKIIASTCVGTFTAVWLEYVVSSVYNVVDEIVVANGGIDIRNPGADNVMLERESKVLKEIDINGKIIEVRGDWQNAKHVNPQRDTMAARNMSIGIQTAYNREANIVLEIKCDQIFYQSVKLIRNLDFKKHSGYQFWEFTNFMGDLFSVPEELKHRGCDDGARLFVPSETDYYMGQGQPMIQAEQFCVDFIQTGHMRYVYPPKYSKEKWEQFAYERAWAHLFCQNSVNEHAVNKQEGRKLTLEEIEKMARGAGRGIATAKGVPLHAVDDPRSPKMPPLAALSDPLEYIRKGYPK